METIHQSASRGKVCNVLHLTASQQLHWCSKRYFVFSYQAFPSGGDTHPACWVLTPKKTHELWCGKRCSQLVNVGEILHQRSTGSISFWFWREKKRAWPLYPCLNVYVTWKRKSIAPIHNHVDELECLDAFWLLTRRQLRASQCSSNRFRNGCVKAVPVWQKLKHLKRYQRILYKYGILQ